MKFLIKSWCFIKSIRYIQLVVLSGDSMSPSLLHGDILVTLKWPHFEKIIQRNSIVICTPTWIENKYIKLLLDELFNSAFFNKYILIKKPTFNQQKQLILDFFFS